MPVFVDKCEWMSMSVKDSHQRSCSYVLLIDALSHHRHQHTDINVPAFLRLFWIIARLCNGSEELALLPEFSSQRATERTAIAQVELEVLEALQRANPLLERRDVAERPAMSELELEVLQALQRADPLPERRDVAELVARAEAELEVLEASERAEAVPERRDIAQRVTLVEVELEVLEPL